MSYLTDHAEDLFRRAEYELTRTSFLSPAEQREIFDALPGARERLVFWGGALGAERRCAFFVPDWMLDAASAAKLAVPDFEEIKKAPPESEATFFAADGDRRADVTRSEASGRGGDTRSADFERGETRSPSATPEFIFPRSLSPLGAFSDEREQAAAILDADGSLTADSVALVRIEGSGFASLGHRDFMGAILNLGIRRETLGDIVVLGESACEAYCEIAAARLIEAELRRIGRDAVKASVGGVPTGARIRREYEETVVNVASLRLDCVVGELIPASREAAKRLIASGAVEVDHREETSADARLSAGVTLSVRGTGKFRLGETLGETRKGRLRVRVYRYV